MKPLRHAYEQSFTRSTVASGLAKTGAYPPNLAHTSSVLLPLSFAQPEKLITAEEMEGILEFKREQLQRKLSIQSAVLRNEF